MEKEGLVGKKVRWETSDTNRLTHRRMLRDLKNVKPHCKNEYNLVSA